MSEPQLGTAETWAALRQPSTGLSARHHPLNGDVWLGLDPEGRRHLIVRADDGRSGTTLMSAKGLNATVTELSFENEPTAVWADIVCLEPALNSTFVAVATDLVREVQAARGSLLDAVRRTLRTWQWFWGVDTTGLSTDAELGLLGEIWLIDRWAPFPEAIEVWLGPFGNRHDFSATAVSVEVKATQVRSDGPARHQIANLDQLSPPETGQLHLFSLQVIADPNATNTLTSLIERVRTRLRDRPDLRADFDRRLAKARWTPAHGQTHQNHWRIIGEELYVVGNGFPRLTRSSFDGGVPSGIDDVRYSLSLAVCTPWRIATQPNHAASLLAALRA